MLSIIVAFTVISMTPEKVILIASDDMITGTDTACESYWQELTWFLNRFETVKIINKAWIPSERYYSNKKS